MTQEQTQRPTQAQRRDATRVRLVTAATDLFSQHGYHGTQVMDIVGQAKVSAGTFYRYFDDKQAIFFAIAQQVAEYERDQWETAHAKTLGATDAVTLIRQSAVNYTEYFERVQKNAALYRVLMNSGVVDPEKHHEWMMHQGAVKMVVGHLKTGGKFDTEDLDSLASMIVGMIGELRLSIIHTGKPKPQKAGRLAARFLQGALTSFTTNRAEQLPSEEWRAALREAAPLDSD